MKSPKFLNSALLATTVLAGCAKDDVECPEPTPVVTELAITEQNCSRVIRDRLESVSGGDDSSVNVAIESYLCNNAGAPVLTDDQDGDGYGSKVDCDDTNPNVHRGAVETCNEVDDNCDGITDNVDPLADPDNRWFIDADDDRFVPEGAEAIVACERPQLGVAASTVVTGIDCDPLNANINPSAYDYPRSNVMNGIDDDCDGLVDGGFQSEIHNLPTLHNSQTTSNEVLYAILRNLYTGSLHSAQHAATDLLGDKLGEARNFVCENEKFLSEASVPVATALATGWALNTMLGNFIRSELIERLDSYIAYLETYDGVAEQAYYDNLDNKDDFIYLDPATREVSALRKDHTEFHRSIAAGCSVEVLLSGLREAKAIYEGLTATISFE